MARPSQCRPSQCRVCGGYEICLWPGTPGCAEDEERGMTLRDRDVCVAAELADAHDLLDLVHSYDLEPVDADGNPISPR